MGSRPSLSLSDGRWNTRRRKCHLSNVERSSWPDSRTEYQEWKTLEKTDVCGLLRLCRDLLEFGFRASKINRGFRSWFRECSDWLTSLARAEFELLARKLDTLNYNKRGADFLPIIECSIFYVMANFLSLLGKSASQTKLNAVLRSNSIM